jgi:hypothetical protein
MKLQYQSRWVRLLIEFFPALPDISRYRIPHRKLEGQIGRLLQRRIAHRLRQRQPEEAR